MASGNRSGRRATGLQKILSRLPVLSWLPVLPVCLGLSLPATAQPYRDADLPVEARVQDLVSRMSLQEKAWQLFMLGGGLEEGVDRFKDGVFGLQLGTSCDGKEPVACANAIQKHFVEETRLGIPVILFGEALHGLVQPGSTVFPQAIGLAATFDTALMQEVGEAIAVETRSRGIRQVLSPVVNIADDVRWGRVEETYGEDPFLAAEMGVAYTSGFTNHGVITTPKHLVANAGRGGRDSYPIELGERLLREIYLPPFEACISRGGSLSVMTSYNSLGGVPASANPWLNRTWLRDEIGFTGFVISDAGAVGGANVLHFTALDYADAASQAITAGLDVIFQTSFDHFELFFPAFREGRIPVEVIDRAVARVLRAKLALGLFEEPYVDDGEALPDDAPARHRPLARQAAMESIVLLKNEAGALPLSRKLGQIAVVGPDAAAARLGGYSGPGNEKVSILEGIRAKLGPGTAVVHAEGCSRSQPGYPTLPADFLTPPSGEASGHGWTGAYFGNIRLDGEPLLTRLDPVIDFKWTFVSPDPERLPADFFSVRWTGKLRAPAEGPFRIGVEGDDGYRLYIDGKLAIDRWRRVSHRTLFADRPLEGGREYQVRLESFEPTGTTQIRLVWDDGVDRGQEAALQEAVDLAARSDAAIVAVGLIEGEFRDRAHLGLPGQQEELIRRVAATGTPTVVILVGGSAVTMTSWLDRVPALLDAWYPGEAGGEAVADVLFGDHNPGGRLPVTFPLAEGQLPLVYNHKPTGRGDDYVDLSGAPLFPFGYGLSYTTFEYSGLRLEPAAIPADGTAIAHVTVKNAGRMAGDEVVQLYIRDELASVARPVLELKGFQRVHLQPGEARTLQFAIGPEILSMLDRSLRTVVEPGTFRVMVGSSSRDIRLQTILTVRP